MRFSFIRLLRGLDDYGHPIRLSYKGEETFQTLGGSILSITVQGLTLAMIITAFTEVFRMQEPKITQYLRPLQAQDRKEIGEVKFADYGYTMGVFLAFDELDPKPIPKEIGTIAAFNKITYWD